MEKLEEIVFQSFQPLKVYDIPNYAFVSLASNISAKITQNSPVLPMKDDGMELFTVLMRDRDTYIVNYKDCFKPALLLKKSVFLSNIHSLERSTLNIISPFKYSKFGTWQNEKDIEDLERRFFSTNPQPSVSQSNKHTPSIPQYPESSKPHHDTPHKTAFEASGQIFHSERNATGIIEVDGMTLVMTDCQQMAVYVNRRRLDVRLTYGTCCAGDMRRACRFDARVAACHLFVPVITAGYMGRLVPTYMRLPLKVLRLAADRALDRNTQERIDVRDYNIQSFSNYTAMAMTKAYIYCVLASGKLKRLCLKSGQVHSGKSYRFNHRMMALVSISETSVVGIGVAKIKEEEEWPSKFPAEDSSGTFSRLSEQTQKSSNSISETMIIVVYDQLSAIGSLETPSPRRQIDSHTSDDSIMATSHRGSSVSVVLVVYRGVLAAYAVSGMRIAKIVNICADAKPSPVSILKESNSKARLWYSDASNVAVKIYKNVPEIEDDEE